MRARRIVAALAFALPLIACIDLFHSTDFETLGDSREAGAEEAAADVATDTSPPPVDFCKWSSAEAREHASRACAWLGACGGPLRESVFGPCMLHALWAYDCDLNPVMRPRGATRELWSCLHDVKTCAEVDACLYPSSPPACGAVASGSFTTCGGEGAPEVLVECGRPQQGPPVGVEPCRLLGKTCTTIDSSKGRCTGEARKVCSLGLSCQGSAAVDCQSIEGVTLDVGIDCASFGGGSCIAEDGGVACAAQGDAGACKQAPFSVDCDGSVATACAGDKAIVVDCSKLGLPCDVSQTPMTPLDPLRACADRVDAGRCSAPDECVGGKLRSCAQGGAFEVDCARVGLRPCEPIAGGVLARCAPPP